MDQKRFIASSVHALPDDHSFNGIDVLKFVCAILICMLHISPFYALTSEQTLPDYFLRECICRLAVPCFLISSGFFLFRKMDLYDYDRDRVQGYIFKMIRLTGVWFMLMIIGWNGILWYLKASIAAVLLLCLLLKAKIKLPHIVLIAGVLFVVGLLGNSYKCLLSPLQSFFIPKAVMLVYDNVFGTTRNGVFFGFAFVLMGALFARKRIVIPTKAAIAGCILSVGLYVLEADLLRRYAHPQFHDIFIFQLPVVFFPFYLASHIQLADRPIYKRLRTVGILVFFLHMMVGQCVKTGLKAAAIIGIQLNVFYFPLTLCLTVVLAVLIDRLSQRKAFGWLRYLYS